MPENQAVRKGEFCMHSSLVTGLQHIGLPTGDLERTVAFYEQFGFQVEWRRDASATDRVAFLRCGSCVIETYLTPSPALVNGAVDHIALDVTDIEAAWRDVSSLGYETLEGKITELPFFARGVRYFTILGPNHEKLEFNQKL